MRVLPPLKKNKQTKQKEKKTKTEFLIGRKSVQDIENVSRNYHHISMQRTVIASHSLRRKQSTKVQNTHVVIIIIIINRRLNSQVNLTHMRNGFVCLCILILSHLCGLIRMYANDKSQNGSMCAHQFNICKYSSM